MFGSKKKRKAELLENHHKIKKETFYFDKIVRYFSGSDHTGFLQLISDKTCQDLDLDEVFMFVDRTVSKVGQQYLYHTLRTIPADRKRSDRLETLISFFNNNTEQKASLLWQMDKLNNNEAYYITSLFQDDHIRKPSWFWIIQLLSLVSVVSILLSYFFPQLVIGLIVMLTINYIIHYWNKKNLYQYGGSIPQLLLLKQVAKDILKAKVPVEEDQVVRQAIKTIDSIGYRMSFFKIEARVQSDIGMVVEYLLEMIKALLLIEPLLLFSVLKQLDTKRKQIHQVYQLVGEVDAAIAIAALRQQLPYCTQPTFTSEKKYLSAKDLYHPLLVDFIPNSIALHGKSALLTGSNMSGKTTFIRTIGINAIVAQTLNTCFAQEFVLSPLRIQTAIRIADDLMSDKSYYFEEVLTIRQMLEESRSGTQNLFLLDELFKGTNTVERIAAGKSVLSYLNQQDNIVLMATHDLELADYLEETYNLYHFTEVVADETILFDYKIKAGNLKATNAIRILALNNYPQEVVNEALQLSAQISKSKGVKKEVPSGLK